VRKESDRLRVVTVATPGVPVFELGIAAEIFGTDRSDLTPDWYDFSLITPGEEPLVIGHGLTVPPGPGLAAVGEAHTVVIPACVDVHDDVPEDLADALRDAHARGARIVSLCSGAFVLAHAGLLDGRRATTHWMHAAELARRFPLVRVEAAALYLRDGDIWTSAGSAAAMDLCLEIVRQDHGRAVANEVARRVVTPPHRAGGQAQYLRYHRDRTAEPVDVTDWVRENLARATVASMAQHAGVSQRTLVRRFHETTAGSPQAWLMRERLSVAQELLESTDLTVETVAARVGLGSAANLRARFTAAFGTGPGQYRRAFARPGEVRPRAG
jgi:AraC family transcriptional activator FtrA